jgi:putative ABC transport system substrate-binding protein
MRRRDFITLLSGAAAAWPLAARAQQPGERGRRISFLLAISQSDPVTQEYLAALAQGLAPLGWREGRNVQIDTRLAGGEASRIRAYAAELVGLSRM